MATFYSNHFSTTASTYDGQVRIPVGEGHGRVRYKKMQWLPDVATTTAADVIRMGQFKSNDRIIELWVYSPDCGASGTADIGLHLSGVAHDGAAVDIDLFETTPLAINGAVARAEFYTDAVLTDGERGSTLWEAAAVGAASYTSDPGVQFDLTMTIGTGHTAIATDGSDFVQIEAFYTSGD